MTDDDIDQLAKKMGITMIEVSDGKGECDPAKLISEGWVYRELSWMPLAIFATMIKTIGEENYRQLAMSERQDTGDRRGQFLISPAGVDNIVAYLAKRQPN